MADVCALVLTYNRKDLLRECLNAVQQQTAPCTRVIVVDNASTDGTLEMIRKDFPDVQVARLRKNVGAAGGFAAGLRMAAATGEERIWVMDDDVICEPGALAELIAVLDMVEGDGLTPPFVISTARAPDGQMTDVPDVNLFRNTVTGFPEYAEYLEQGLVAVTRATLASSLIPRRTFQRFGFPLASMFIYGEDAEFTFRVTKNNNPGFLSGKSRVEHRRTQKVLDIITEQNPERIRWHGYLSRNHIYTARMHRGPIRLLWRLILEWRRFVRVVKVGQFRKAFVIARGTLAGLWFKPAAADLDSRIDEEAIEYMSPDLRCALRFDVSGNEIKLALPIVEAQAV
jgi:GT2 family glycosyltransferase